MAQAPTISETAPLKFTFTRYTRVRGHHAIQNENQSKDVCKTDIQEMELKSNPEIKHNNNNKSQIFLTKISNTFLSLKKVRC